PTQEQISLRRRRLALRVRREELLTSLAFLPLADTLHGRAELVLRHRALAVLDHVTPDVRRAARLDRRHVRVHVERKEREQRLRDRVLAESDAGLIPAPRLAVLSLDGPVAGFPLPRREGHRV